MHVYRLSRAWRPPEGEGSKDVRSPVWWLLRLLFIVMVLGWISVVVNFFLQDLSGDRRRDDGIAGLVVGAVATVLFLAMLGVEWYRAVRALAADRRDPAPGGAMRRERDECRRRGRAASGWAAATVLVGLLLTPPLVVAVQDLRKPDDMWPSDQLTQFDVVADDAMADAEELENVLRETAGRLGFDNRLGYVMSREECRLPDGSVGIYLDFDLREYDGPTDDPEAVVESVAEYWDGLGYSAEVSEKTSAAGESTFSVGTHTPSGGFIYIQIGPDSTRFSGSSGCSAVED